jgi:TPP-dependent pyruvate/acetoin dehydrogenase alpha subunit
VEAVWTAAGDAIHAARKGEGPALLECRTYRVLGHHEGDPGVGYRTKDEVESWKARCPISRAKARLLDQTLASDREIRSVEEEVETTVKDAVQFADASPWPSPAEACNHVFPGDDVSGGQVWTR